MTINGRIRLGNVINATISLGVTVINTGGGGGSVSIIDQDNNTIATVSAPGSYQVIVLNGIDDQGAPYQMEVIDGN